MATLVIKTFPQTLHSKLKQSAVQNRRSVTQQAIVLLEQALNEDSTMPSTGYWKNRKVTVELNESLQNGAFAEGAESTAMISDERDSR